MKQVVVFTGHNRPHYMRQALGSWSRVRGVGNCLLDFHLEPGCPEMAALCESVGFAERVVKVNPERYGVLRNPCEALACGFATGADFVILAEDDLVVSTDVLEFFAWAKECYRDDPEILGVCAHVDWERPGGLPGTVRMAWFFVWVWGIWRDRWERLVKPDWTFDYRHKGWDWRLSEHWCMERGYRFITPAVSRSQHIGQHGGTHMRPEQFAALQSKCFTADVPPQRYMPA